MNFSSPEFKVGALITILSIVIGGMALKISQGTKVFSRNTDYQFELESARGLVKNGNVKVAGISVGFIKEIELVGRNALITISLDSNVPVDSSSVVDILSKGILGDRFIDLRADQSKSQPLKPGEKLKVGLQGSAISGVISKLNKMAEVLQRVAINLNTTLTGGGTSETPLGRIILNIESLTSSLSGISTENRESIHRIVSRLDSITGSMDEFLDKQNPESFPAGWKKVSESIQSLGKSLENIEDITSKVNRGEGTIGRLINSEETVDSINMAINNINRVLGGVGSLQTTFDYHGEYLEKYDEVKNYISLKLKPGLDRYYQVSLISDKKGVTEEELIDRDEDGDKSRILEKRTFKDKFKFSLVMAKSFYDITLKGGLIENSGGFGFDYHLFNKDLRISVEAFDFKELNLKTSIKYNIFKGIYLITGNHRISRKSSSTFFGGGIFITNEDLKVLASQLGSLAR